MNIPLSADRHHQLTEFSNFLSNRRNEISVLKEKKEDQESEKMLLNREQMKKNEENSALKQKIDILQEKKSVRSSFSQSISPLYEILSSIHRCDIMI